MMSFFCLLLNDDEDDVELEMHQGVKDEKWRQTRTIAPRIVFGHLIQILTRNTCDDIFYDGNFDGLEYEDD